jgi:nucleoside triphosphate diphosphatase
MTQYTTDDLIRLMACLRHPENGCPWDLKQTYPDVVPFTLEEAYEVADAIERGAYAELPGELGDLLFQVVFYARLGEEEGRFTFSDIVHGLVEKLLMRHPHVFPDASFESFGTAADISMTEIKGRWESQKASERSARGQLGLFDDVPNALPALTRAQKIQKRARGVGYDWPDQSGVMTKLAEEFAELEEAQGRGDPERVMAEFGDVLFTVVSLGRHLGVDCEQSLRLATGRFQQRIAMVERIATEEGAVISELDDQGRERLWQIAKQRLQASFE